MREGLATMPDRGRVLRASRWRAYASTGERAENGARTAGYRRRLLATRRALHAARRALRVDSMTGLANRLGLDEAIVARRASGHPWSLAFIDLDHFKALNDRFGHAAGDAVLTEVARRLALGAGEQASVARLGGDEFAAVIPLPAPSAAALMEQVLDLVSQPQRLQDGTTCHASASVGVVDADPDIDITDLKRRADATLYEAKDQRGRVATWTPSTDMTRHHTGRETEVAPRQRAAGRLRNTAVTRLVACVSRVKKKNGSI